MKRLIPLLLAGACHLAAHAAAPLPADVAGSWGTSESPDAGATAHTVMYLHADGYGLMAGSAPPEKRADGADDGNPGARAIIGFPIRAALVGATLQLSPYSPRYEPADQAAPADVVVMTCRYDAAAPSLTCTGPDNSPIVLRRLAAPLPPEAASAIAQMKALDKGA